LADIAYCAVTKKNYNFNQTKNIIDFFIFYLFLIIIFITFERDLKNTIYEGPNVVSLRSK